MRKLTCLVAALVFFTVPAWAQSNPFDTAPESVITVTTPLSTFNAIASEPIAPLDPLASATEDGRLAERAASAMIDVLKDNVKKRDVAAIAKSFRFFETVKTVIKDKKKVVVDAGVWQRMKDGGVDQSRIDYLKGMYASYRSQVYGELTSKLVGAARDFEGYSSAKGPGGGNVSCAWLVSRVLRKAGIVSETWDEWGALNLTQRLVREFGFTKVPSTGKAASGVMKASAMKPGDIVFWSPNEHVGVYLGNGMVMSNSSSEHEGKIHPVAGYYNGWVPRFVVRPPGNS